MDNRQEIFLHGRILELVRKQDFCRNTNGNEDLLGNVSGQGYFTHKYGLDPGIVPIAGKFL